MRATMRACMLSLTYKTTTEYNTKEKMQMKKLFQIVCAWLRPKEPTFTEAELKERQEMEELLERVRAWEAYYWEHETPEQRQRREFLESMRGFAQF